MNLRLCDYCLWVVEIFILEMKFDLRVKRNKLKYVHVLFHSFVALDSCVHIACTGNFRTINGCSACLVFTMENSYSTQQPILRSICKFSNSKSETFI